MGKAVLISIHPCWCEQITSGAKTMEVRKSRPKLETPFKCYIYQTKAKWVFDLLRKIGFDRFADILERGFGKVIGEFVCDSIRCFDVPYPAYQNKMDKDILDQTCCTYYQLHRYAYHDNLYGWHISDLKIYPNPMTLDWFRKPMDCHPVIGSDKCHGCHQCELKRAPQSWCYVDMEEKEDAPCTK